MLSNSDIQGLAIISAQGLPICSLLSRDVSDELISAMSAAILSVSERTLRELARGDLRRILIEGIDGIIILSKAGENAILCTLAKSEALLGLVFLNIQSLSNRIAKLLYSDYHDDDNGGGDFPYPYIFKPPTPPGDLGLASESQTKLPITEKIQEYEPYCKHCGAELPKGQSICHVCGKKVG